MSPRAPASVAELSPPARALARLLPGVYLARNEGVEDRPLLLLLEVLGKPLAELERAIEQLGDDHFVERASADALPLLAELVGARLLADDARANRTVVARTLRWRRRKGSLRTLEEVLSLTSGWSAEVDEAFRSLVHTQDLANLVPWRGRNALLPDPVALAAPLSRPATLPAAATATADGTLLGRAPGESVEQALVRLGRADAGRHAASPRTVDLLGWARPEHAVILTSRLVHAELDRVEAAGAVPVQHRTDPAVAFAGFTLDPLGRDLPLLGRGALVRPDADATLTAAHEPAPAAAADGFRHDLLTPTALAAAGDAAEQDDSVSVFVDDVRLVGVDPPPAAGVPLAFEPVGPEAVLRFADAGRPAPADRWDLQLAAVDDPDQIAVTVLATPPVPGAGGENPVLVGTVARDGGRDPERALPAAGVARGGASVALRVSRSGSATGYRRRAGGAWETFTIGAPPGQPVSDAVALEVGGTRVVMRLERRPQGGLALSSWHPDSAASRWTSRPVRLDVMADVDQPDFDAPADGAALAAAAVDGAFVFVAPVAGTGTLGVWRIAAPDTAPLTPTRIDLDGPRRPPARMAPSLCVHGGRLLVFGGEQDGRVHADLWSIALDGAGAGRWTPHVVRNRQRRAGGRLLSTPAGVVLVGGASIHGRLETSVWLVDLARSRPRWEALDPLPLDPGRTGAAWARMDGTVVEVLAWADRAVPVLLRAEGGRGWSAGAPEPAAPNPPAEGEGLFVDADFTAAGPPPLPPSEVVFRLGGAGRIAFLPALDLAPAGAAELFFVLDDASTERWFPPGVEARPSLRVGAGRDAPSARRTAPADRIGVPGRLDWHPLGLRQVSLGLWARPFALDLPDRVGIDPRLGRVVVRQELAQGRVGASFRIGRAGAAGAGFSPPGRAVPAAWTEPPDPDDPGRAAVPLPPDQDAARPAGPARPTAWVSPRRAGLPGDDGVPVVATLADAVRVARPVHSVGVLGSPRLDAASLAIGESHVVSVWPAESGSFPHVAAEEGVSLSLHERLAPGAAAAAGDPDDPGAGPSWFLTGLSLAGAVDLAVAAGEADMRWCTVAVPGEPALRVAGAGHQPPLLRHSIPRPLVRVRLYGCQLGRVELPPWVELTAAGCTFDAGDPALVALSAAGASLRLRHCTVQGQTLAGRLMASSCAFKGTVVCDRPDQSWARYCLLPPGGRPPLLYRSHGHHVSFASITPTSPVYLALAGNNGAAALAAGERGLEPGAYADRAPRLLELTARTDDFLPLALVPHHLDRAVEDLDRMNRRLE